MKWEYKDISLRSLEKLGDISAIPYKATDGLNKLGADEWELVSVDDGIAYFKRPLHAADEIMKHFDTGEIDVIKNKRSSLV